MTRTKVTRIEVINLKLYSLVLNLEDVKVSQSFHRKCSMNKKAGKNKSCGTDFSATSRWKKYCCEVTKIGIKFCNSLKDSKLHYNIKMQSGTWNTWHQGHPQSH